MAPATGRSGRTGVTVHVQPANGGTAPAISVQPQNHVRAGATATFSLTATGTGPFNYQWFRDGAPIAGTPSARTADSRARPGGPVNRLGPLGGLPHKTPSRVLLGERTAELVRGRVAVVEQGSFAVKGKAAEVPVYGLARTLRDVSAKPSKPAATGRASTPVHVRGPPGPQPEPSAAIHPYAAKPQPNKPHPKQAALSLTPDVAHYIIPVRAARTTRGRR